MKYDEKGMVLERMVKKGGIPKRTARILQIGFPLMQPRDNWEEMDKLEEID